MCLLDYDYHILNNAFLIHRPGIKTVAQSFNDRLYNKTFPQFTLIRDQIIPELIQVLGANDECKMVTFYVAIFIYFIMYIIVPRKTPHMEWKAHGFFITPIAAKNKQIGTNKPC